MKNDNVQKSVRMPPDLVAYIEQQPGTDFSKKLINLLQDIREGDENRQRMLENYEEQLKHKQKRLEELTSKIYDASEVLRRLSSALSYADSMME